MTQDRPRSSDIMSETMPARPLNGFLWHTRGIKLLNYPMNLSLLKKVHLIGIGGSGLAALADLLLQKNVQVTGSDLVASLVTKDLESKGAKIYIGEHQVSNIADDVDLVVCTVAAPIDNRELVQAKKLGIKTLTYPQFIGELSQQMFTIAVAGTHGKTTSTAMIGVMLERAGLDPTVIVGSYAPDFKGSARLGKSKYLVIEADEYRRAFLNYQPKIAVVLNIEFDHPDCYENIGEVQQAFTKFSGRADKVVKNIDQLENDLDLQLKLPGQHYLHDALAAQEVGRLLNIDDKVIKSSLESYQGSVRRFELKGEIAGVTVIDDYAHHPTEIKATLRAAKEKYPQKRIIAVWQPHHQERTQELFSDFGKSFGEADKVVVTDIYQVAGRKKEVEITAQDLAEKIIQQGNQVKYVSQLNKVVDYLADYVKQDDVVLIMGAGDVTKVAGELIEKLNNKDEPVLHKLNAIGVKDE